MRARARADMRRATDQFHQDWQDTRQGLAEASDGVRVAVADLRAKAAAERAKPRGYSVTRYRKSTSHTFHLLMTLITCGLWLPVWAIVSMWHAFGPRDKAVTQHV
jgi:hypothetical protein